MHESAFLRAIRGATVPDMTHVPRGLAPSDYAEFETLAGDPRATARRILAAAATRDAGGPLAAKMSTSAQAIIDAGKRRRGE